jgi:molecular chaperone GrpE
MTRKKKEEKDIEKPLSSQDNSVENQEDAATKSAEEKEPTTEELIEKYERTIVEQQDKYLRLSAEFDNYRKRTLKEKIEWTKSSNAELIIKILPVMDDFERGIQHLEDAQDLNAIKEGMDLIYTKFQDFLNQQGIKEIEALHQELNVDLHEAITKIPVNDESLKGKIVDVIEKGYLLNDKVIRYAKVVIGE